MMGFVEKVYSLEMVVNVRNQQNLRKFRNFFTIFKVRTNYRNKKSDCNCNMMCSIQKNIV